MHRTRSRWHIGMPHTICGALGEVALFAYSQDQHWNSIGALVGCPASRLIDAAGTDVYASIYFADFQGGAEGLAGFAPDDELEVVGEIGRYGPSMLDGVHYLYPAGALPAELPVTLPPAPSLRLSFVLVSAGIGPEALRVSAPTNATMSRIPSLPSEPDSYRLVKEARESGAIAPPPSTGALWPGVFMREYAINPDRDLNGVGLLYFANYVAFLDSAERDALQEAAGLSAEKLYRRVTLQRRVAYYANAQPSDRLRISVAAHAPAADPNRFTVHHRVERVSDGRLVTLGRAERRLRA